MADERLYEVCFTDFEGAYFLNYVQAISEGEAEIKFLSNIDQNVKIHYVLTTCVNIYED